MQVDDGSGPGVDAPGALDPRQAADLALDLAPFSVPAVQDVLGPMASGALHRGQPVAARLALAGRAEPAVVWARLMLVGGAVRRAELDAAAPRTGTDGLVGLGLVQAAGRGDEDLVRARVDLRPYAADDATWWLASDVGELVTGGPLRPDHVLGVGGASATLARWTPRTAVVRALDVGTGCGVQAFHLARLAEQVTATDVSARALAFTRFNAALNAAVTGGPFADRDLELLRGDLLESVAGREFDLVVSNPPFVITPRHRGVPTYEYRDGGRSGDDLVAQAVAGAAGVLAPGGVAQLLGNWELRRGQPWRERVAAWLPADVDGWVVQRDVQDVGQYAETWARDGGHRPGTPAHEQLLRLWVEDLLARGVEGVGFGVITLRRRTTSTGPALRRLEEVSAELDAAPLGATVAAVLTAEAALATWSDDDLLARHLVVAPDVTQEQHGRPGDPDPQVLLLRQGGGLRRLVRADTALAGLVGACDGELTVGQVVGALGVLLDEPAADLRARLVPAVRGLVADGLLLDVPR